jgi:RNA-directed DNA polymerase
LKERCKGESKVRQPDLFNYDKSLFEQICSIETLQTAFKAVRKNRGAPGIDGITIGNFERNLPQELTQLKRELESWEYKPNPVRRIEISKPQGGIRLLGIPCVRDRVVQAAIKVVLEPIYEPLFSEHSYGFRPGRNQRQAIEAAQKIVQSGKEFVVDIDLSKFFDRIQHDRLIYRLGQQIQDKRVLRLIGSTLRSGIMKDGLLSPSKEGSVQGSPLSPLLSNVVLDELDKELEQRGLSFCRFADDSNIFVKSQHAADRVMRTVTKFIEKRLKLVVNREKSKVAISSAVKFLGMTIVMGALAISLSSINRAMDRVKELTPRGTHLPIEQTMREINSWYRGWSSYYSMTQYPAQLAKIEAHIRRRLRSRLVRQQKKRRHLYKKLIKLGVRHRTARVAFTNQKWWALSHSAAVERAWPNRWFTNTLGQYIASNQQLSNWYDLSRWIKLT